MSVTLNRARHPKLKRTLRSIARNWDLYLLLVPVLAYFIIFHYAPMYGVQIAFRRYSIRKGILGSQWVGMAHFNRFFQSYYFERLLVNTLTISLYNLALGFPLPILLALLLAAHSGKFFRKAAIGALLLIPFQAFTISMVLLKDLAFRSGAGGETFTQFQLEMIAYGYQLGTLLVPTVAPIVIWLWLDKKYVTTVLFNGWFDKQAGKAATPAGPAAPDAPAATQQALAAPDVPAATPPGETVPKA